MNILADGSLPGLAQAFPTPFKLTLFERQTDVSKLLKKQDILIGRASLKVDKTLIKKQKLFAVATASSGSDNLDQHFLHQQNIITLDAKGCNAIAVADYVMSSLAFIEHQNLLKGKQIGIIGLGHVGCKVYDRLKVAGYIIHCYDPPKSVKDSSFISCSLEKIYQCDLICIHAALHQTAPYPTLNLISNAFLQQLKPGSIILNASRGDIVDEKAIIKAFPRVIYCTDVYSNEPCIQKDIVQCALIATPHIAGHSIEAKHRAVEIISSKIHQLLNLSYPNYLIPNKPSPLRVNSTSWQKLALAIYNPCDETVFLKQAQSTEEAFISLRQKHQFRHDFATYFFEPTSNN